MHQLFSKKLSNINYKNYNVIQSRKKELNEVKEELRIEKEKNIDIIIKRKRSVSEGQLGDEELKILKQLHGQDSLFLTGKDCIQCFDK